MLWPWKPRAPFISVTFFKKVSCGFQLGICCSQNQYLPQLSYDDTCTILIGTNNSTKYFNRHIVTLTQKKINNRTLGVTCMNFKLFFFLSLSLKKKIFFSFSPSIEISTKPQTFFDSFHIVSHYSVWKNLTKLKIRSQPYSNNCYHPIFLIYQPLY